MSGSVPETLPCAWQLLGGPPISGSFREALPDMRKALPYVL